MRGLIDSVTLKAGAAVRRSFGFRLVAAYVIGGRSEGTAHNLSDIDMVLILRFRVNETDEQIAKYVRAQFLEETSVVLDLVLRGSVEIQQNGCEYIFLGSHLLEGSRSEVLVPLPNIDRYQAKTYSAAERAIARVRGVEHAPAELQPPNLGSSSLGYLDPVTPGRARQVVGLIANLLRYDLASLGEYTAYKSENLKRYVALQRPEFTAMSSLYRALRAHLDGTPLCDVHHLPWESILVVEKMTVEGRRVII